MTLAGLALCGIAAMVSATAVRVSTTGKDPRSAGREMMIDAQYQLARSLKR
jgi:hypothetical protein